MGLERRRLPALPPVGRVPRVLGLGLRLVLIALAVVALGLLVAALFVEDVAVVGGAGVVVVLVLVVADGSDDAGEGQSEDGADGLQEGLVVGGEGAGLLAEEDQGGEGLAEVGAVDRQQVLRLEQ